MATQTRVLINYSLCIWGVCKIHEVITRTADYILENHKLHIGEEKFEISEDDHIKFTILQQVLLTWVPSQTFIGKKFTTSEQGIRGIAESILSSM